MRAVVACAVLFACGHPDVTMPSDGGALDASDVDAISDASHDDEEVDPGPPVAAPLSCDEGGTLPALPPICIDSWCTEAPHPLAHAAAMVGTANERWFALPAHLVRIAGTHTTAYPLPAPQLTQLVGSATAGIWAFSFASFRAMQFDGSQWHVMPPVGALTLVPLAPNDVWAFNDQQVLHGDGVAWQIETLPLAGAEITALAASSSNHVWAAATRYDEVSEQLVYYLLHRNHGVWSAAPVPWRVFALWSSGPHNVWLSTGSSIVHYDGTTFVEQAALEATALVGRTRNDVWAMTTGPNASVSHWDGISWTTCARPGVQRLALGDGEVWTFGEGHAVAHYAGQWASVPQLSGLEVVHTVAGSSDVLAGGANVMLRRTAAGWTNEPGFPAMYVRGMASSAPDRIWAYGTGAARFDGTSWIDTGTQASISSLCIGDGEHAFAAGYGSSLYYDGQSWVDELPLGPGDQMLCGGGDDVWIGNGTDTSIAHRENGQWSRTASEPWVGWTHVAGSVLWSIGGNALMRVENGEWLAPDLRGAAALLPAGTLEVREVTGTSVSDTWLLVDLRTSATEVEQHLVHHDGVQFDRAVRRDGVKKIAALAPDDLIVVSSRFETVRLTAATATTLFAGFTSDHALGYGSGAIHMFSATDGWAVSDEGRLLHFDGTTWSVVPGFATPYAASRLLAFSPAQIWVLQGSSIARFDGTSWTTQPIALQPGEWLLGFWGATPADVWLTTSSARALHLVNNIVAPVTVAVDPPHELGLVRGTSPTDVWFSGRYLEQFQYLPTVYHWDGTTLTRYRTLRRATAMRRIGSDLFATAYDFTHGQEVWQYASGHWIVRPDLAPNVVFADVFGRPLLPYTGTGNRGVGGGPWYGFNEDPYSPGAQLLWRRP